MSFLVPVLATSFWLTCTRLGALKAVEVDALNFNQSVASYPKASLPTVAEIESENDSVRDAICAFNLSVIGT